MQRSITVLFFGVLGAACAAQTEVDSKNQYQHGHKQGHGVHHDFSNAEEWAKHFDNPTRDAWQKPQEVVAHLKLSAGQTTALKPGGLLMIVDFHLDSEMGPPKHARISAETVKETLHDGGFSTEILDEDLPHQHVVVGEKR